MLLLILLVPIAFLGALLAFMTWNKKREVAFIMAGISVVCSSISLAIIFASYFLVDSLPK